MPTLATRHNPDAVVDELPTIPVPRVPGLDWPGAGDVAFVPAALLLAARGKCSCPNCVDGFVRLVRRSRLHAV